MGNPLDGSDEEFNSAGVSFGAWLATHFASIGLSSADNTAIQNGLVVWIAKYAAFGPAQNAAAVSLVEKDNSRKALADLMREPAKRVTVPADRTAAGLNVYTERRGRVPAPTTPPILMVDTSQRFKHTIKFSDETTPGSRAKPDGVHHIEIWYLMGPTPPAGPEDCEYLATDTNTPYEHYMDAADAGKMCHYMARWVNSRGEFGPWSETVSATVTG